VSCIGRITQRFLCQGSQKSTRRSFSKHAQLYRRLQQVQKARGAITCAVRIGAHQDIKRAPWIARMPPSAWRTAKPVLLQSLEGHSGVCMPLSERQVAGKRGSPFQGSEGRERVERRPRNLTSCPPGVQASLSGDSPKTRPNLSGRSTRAPICLPPGCQQKPPPFS
jgi:hypothetical protein